MVTSGSFTPLILGSGGQSGQVYGFQIGRYIKNDNLVLCQIRVTLTTLGTLTTSVQVGNLPFNSLNIPGLQIPCVFGSWLNMTTNWLWIGGYMFTNSNVINITGTKVAGTGPVAMLQADMSNITDWALSITYETN